MEWRLALFMARFPFGLLPVALVPFLAGQRWRLSKNLRVVLTVAAAEDPTPPPLL
jgi:hypothetical protein